MVPATKLQYEFKRRLNRLDSKYRKDFYPDEIDSYLNEAKDIIYCARLELMETSPKVKEELRQMEVKEQCLNCIAHKTNKDACIVTLPTDYFRKARYRAKITRDETCGEKEAFIRIMTSDKLTEALKDPLRAPSYEYEEALMDEYDGGFLVFHNKQFKVLKVCLDYYKKLEDVATPSLMPDKEYTNSSGTKVVSDNGLQIDNPNFWMDIVDLAVLNASRDLGAIQDYNTQKDKVLSIERYKI